MACVRQMHIFDEMKARLGLATVNLNARALHLVPNMQSQLSQSCEVNP